MPYGTASIDAIDTSGNLAVTGNVTTTGNLTTSGTITYKNFIKFNGGLNGTLCTVR